MAPKVALVKCSNYDEGRLKTSIKKALELTGGISKFIKPNMKVLLKPNLLSASSPKKAITTHPLFLKSIINVAKEAGAKPFVAESPGGINSAKAIEKILEATGVKEVCELTQTEIVIFDNDVADVNVPKGKLYKSMRIGKAVLKADLIIALPKLKTHGLMKMTAAVKVLFGMVPGLLKAQFHLKVPDRLNFAHMLIDLYTAIKPRLSIADGIVAMEGSGPSAGDPYNLGVILASEDAVALDVVAARLMGYRPFDVYTNRAALERGLTCGEVDIVGDDFLSAKATDFKLILDTADRFPEFLVERAKNVATAKPYLASKNTCTSCGTCVKNCPTEAIILKSGLPQFGYGKCIRCYCCSELCPEQALDLKVGFFAKIFSK